MSFINTLNFILKHPLNKNHKLLALKRYLKWEINIRLNPYPIIFPFGENSNLIMKNGYNGAVGNLLCGLHEFEDMAFVLHFLRQKDLFVDVGANVGSYTILSASEKNAKTISIEPVPQTFEILKENVKLNKLEEFVELKNIGLGSSKGLINFTSSKDTTNHVATVNEKNLTLVNVERFDELITLNNPTLVKIDVEGYETEVIKGMENALKSGFLKAIIIELNGSGKRYGYDESLIHHELLKNGFSSYGYDPFKRELNEIENYGTHNTLYIKDINFVRDRIKNASKIMINQNSF